MLTFRDIRGHRDIISRLSAAVVRQTTAAAYLFYGPEGIGKFATAKAFARAVNCDAMSAPGAGGGAGARPHGDCGSCSSCLRIEAGSHPDVHVIDEGYDNEIKIESVRQLQQEIFLRPYEARHKVFIINDSHNLNTVSANALLKTLEDTPEKSIIILVTDKPRGMPSTIVSRCRRENFRPLSRNDFATALDAEGFDETSRDYLNGFCEGRIGLALRFRGSPVMREKNGVIDALLSGRLDDSMKREDIRKWLTTISVWFRDVYMAKLGADTIINADRRSDLERCAGRYGFDDLERVFAGISCAFLHLEQNVNSKLLLANLQLCLNGPVGAVLASGR